ncbi:hypothetical protein POM88_014143 [Heracleum sosnowskyi]|uniref:Protein FAR1-RELATED SEQUENCE n=1 Tax=Heracleum sosnowskyi TaxID=360622 RepID=A0AAD8N3Y0_9APIA|nr:hypothetical protein POM88_014143 [Heracleum sosnowskyi]
MSTTQRSESMNAFFDDYVNAITSLRELVGHPSTKRKRSKIETAVKTLKKKSKKSGKTDGTRPNLIDLNVPSEVIFTPLPNNSRVEVLTSTSETTNTNVLAAFV